MMAEIFDAMVTGFAWAAGVLTFGGTMVLGMTLFDKLDSLILFGRKPKENTNDK